MQPLNFRSDASQPVFDPDEVLALVAKEHQQTRRPVTPGTVYVLCNAKNGQPRSTLRLVLQQLVRDGRLVMDGLGWVPGGGVCNTPS